MMARVFFKATEDALNNITELFKLVHPLRTSMHYTRNAVAQMDADNPNSDDDYFKSIIDPDDNVHGTGFRDAFIDTPWAEQEEQLAWLLLNNLFAIHEGWVDSIFHERFEGKGYGRKNFIDRLEATGLSAQFTSYYVTNSKRSQLLTDAFYDVYVFCYDLRDNGKDDILCFNIPYLKQNTKMFFPSYMFFRKTPKSLRYEIQSKHSPEVYKGMLELVDGGESNPLELTN